MTLSRAQKCNCTSRRLRRDRKMSNNRIRVVRLRIDNSTAVARTSRDGQPEKRGSGLAMRSIVVDLRWHGNAGADGAEPVRDSDITNACTAFGHQFAATESSIDSADRIGRTQCAIGPQRADAAATNLTAVAARRYA